AGNRDVTLTSNGHGFLVSWLTSFGPSGPDLVAMPLDGAGHPSAVPGVIARSVASFVPASNGNEYLAVVSNYFGGAPYGVRLSANGQFLNQAGMPGIPISASALCWDGFEYIYTFVDGPIRALRLTSGGAPFGEAAYVTAESAPHTMASIGRTLLLVWDRGVALQAEVIDAATM